MMAVAAMFWPDTVIWVGVALVFVSLLFLLIFFNDLVGVRIALGPDEIRGPPDFFFAKRMRTDEIDAVLIGIKDSRGALGVSSRGGGRLWIFHGLRRRDMRQIEEWLEQYRRIANVPRKAVS